MYVEQPQNPSATPSTPSETVVGDYEPASGSGQQTGASGVRLEEQTSKLAINDKTMASAEKPKRVRTGACSWVIPFGEC